MLNDSVFMIFRKKIEEAAIFFPLCFSSNSSSSSFSSAEDGAKEEREREQGRGDDAANVESPSGLHPFWLSASSGPQPGPGI